MQQLNPKETKEVSGGFVIAIPLIVGGWQAFFQGAAILTGAAFLEKMLRGRHTPVPVMNPTPPPKKDPPDIHHFDGPNKEKDKK